ncbi:synaptic vesicle glycoprotein 2C-like [Antedon mediterranea]|uniref:synaptic vesicle glycoprotein 2C-like n=1 Tax=Antedon mediterranea TaxID=105859 RepID=UPI003AF692D9
MHHTGGDQLASATAATNRSPARNNLKNGRTEAVEMEDVNSTVQYGIEGDSMLSTEEDTPLLNAEDEDDEREAKDGSGLSYDESIEIVGFGKFHILLLAVCGWANASDAVETLSISFILPSAKCEMDLSSFQLGVLSAAIFLGMMVGGYVWGALSDIRGRRSVLLWSLSCNALFGLLSSIAQSYWLFVLMRFLSGVGVGGATPVIFSYFGEFQPKKWRGAMISLLSMFWMCGNIIAAGIAWIIIPKSINNSSKGFSYTSWRVFISCCVVPAFTSVLTFIFMPESPKFLLENGQEDKALKAFKTMWLLNKGTRKGFKIFSLRSVASEDQIQQRVSLSSNLGWIAYYKDNLIGMLRSTAELFDKKLCKITILQLIIISTLSFGYYGLYIWFPVLFQQVEITGSACRVSNSSDTNDTCINGVVEYNPQVYKDSFYTAASNLPGNIIATCLIDVVGRRSLVSSSLILSGISVFFIWLVRNRTQVLIMSCIFGGISTIAWNSFNVLQVELYPTHLRSTAIGAIALANRLGAICSTLVFGALINVYCAVPIFMVAILMVFGGLLVWALPNTTRISLE